MKPHLIIFDIDETLYINHESRIPESTFEAIDKLKKAGHTIAIATGRSFYAIMDEVKQLPIDFYILANGQLVMRDDEVIYENAIEMELIRELMVDTEAVGIHLGFNTATHSFLTALTDEIRDSFSSGYTLPKVSQDIENQGSIYQIWYFSGEYTEISEKFKDRLRFIPWIWNGGADILPIGVSKAFALTKMLEVLDDDIYEKTVFFGDGINDIELIEMADIGVAMGNAAEPVKEVADFVTKNIEDDGVYYACEQLGLF